MFKGMLFALLFAGTLAFAAGGVTPPGQPPATPPGMPPGMPPGHGGPMAKCPPCQQVMQACAKAGFKFGDAKNGDGLWMDCINPIMTGKPNPKAKKPLPTVDAGTVSACHQCAPNFGEGSKQPHQ